MAWPDKLQPMSLPVIGAPLFIISIRSSCSRNVQERCDRRLFRRSTRAAANWTSDSACAIPKSSSNSRHQRKASTRAAVARFAVNQIIHASNDRLAARYRSCEKY